MSKSVSAREAGSELERAVEGRISWGRGKHKHTGGIYWFGGVWAGKPARVYAPQKQKLTWEENCQVEDIRETIVVSVV